MFTIITDEARTVDATVDGVHVRLDPDALPAAVGWELKPQGLCQGDVCIPVRDLAATGSVDLAALAAALGRPIVIDPDAAIAAVGLAGELRRQALEELAAPPFTLPDLDGAPHTLAEWRGRKKLLIAFSSW